MTPSHNLAPQTPRRLAARRAGIRLVARGLLTPESLDRRPVEVSTSGVPASSGAAGGDLGRSHSAWLDMERL